MMLSNVEKRKKSRDVAWSTPSIIQFNKEMFLNLIRLNIKSKPSLQLIKVADLGKSPMETLKFH